ncbi:MAG: DUF1622 domain-containing protein [Leucobacter sp.]
MTTSGFFAAIIDVFEMIGVIALCVGFVISAWLSIRALAQGQGGAAAFQVLRRTLGGTILLGLEIFVAADIVRTLYAPTLEETLILGLIIVIRTVLSMSIQIEIDGVLPWRRALLTSGAQVLADAVNSGKNSESSRDGESSESSN